MPVHKVKGGWRYGHRGHGHKVYKNKAGAIRQARAIGIAKARGRGYHIPLQHIAKRNRRKA